MGRRTYTEEDKATALATLKANAGNLERAARACGIPRNTLRRWMADPPNAAPEALRQQKVVEASDRWSEVRDRGLDVVLEILKSGQKVALRDASWTAAVATDKVQLLTGKPTERTEVLSLADFLKGSSGVPAPTFSDPPRPTPTRN